MTSQVGYFVDWNGDTRSVANPGPGLYCGHVVTRGEGAKAWQSVDVLKSEGEVIFEAVYYPTTDAIAALGVPVNLVQ